VNDKRPVNLDIGSIHFPVTAVVSIFHRISGSLLIAGFAVFLYFLDMSLSTPEGFATAAEMLVATPVKVLAWVILSATAYHTTAGIKHLVMDMGVGESLEGGVLAARLTLVIAVILIAVSGWWVMSW
jgi:succinate dehydrogenase / fumarate reductase cytochrome b subunit